MAIFFIPAALDIESLMKDHPPSNINSFKKSDLIYLLHIISSVRRTSRSFNTWNEFVPLKADLLRKKVRYYRAYLDYLIDAGIIISDNWYIKGFKCIGYMFTPAYCGTLVPVEVNDYCLERSIGNERKLTSKESKEYNFLIKWFNERFTIDYEGALEYITNEFYFKLHHPDLRDYNITTKAYKNPYHQYNNSLMCAENFRISNFSFSIDDTGFRFHSLLTSCNSALRNFLQYDDNNLVSIDVANSQPYLCCLLFNPLFWNDIEKYTINISTSNIFSSTSDYSSFIMMCNIEQSLGNSDVHEFKRLVENGELYNYIESHLSKTHNRDKLSKSNIKATVFQVLFTDNRFFGQKDAYPKRVFKALFPSVYKLLALLKKKNKNTLPILLQRIESKLIISTICKRIAKEKPELPIFTIHDSIITTAGNEAYIKQVMEDELTLAVGFTPLLRIEHWSPDNLVEHNNYVHELLQRVA